MIVRYRVVRQQTRSERIWIRNKEIGWNSVSRILTCGPVGVAKRQRRSDRADVVIVQMTDEGRVLVRVPERGSGKKRLEDRKWYSSRKSRRKAARRIIRLAAPGRNMHSQILL